MIIKLSITMITTIYTDKALQNIVGAVLLMVVCVSLFGVKKGRKNSAWEKSMKRQWVTLCYFRYLVSKDRVSVDDRNFILRARMVDQTYLFITCAL